MSYWKWIGAILLLLAVGILASSSIRNDLERLIDFLIGDSARFPGSPFLLDEDSLASHRDTAVSTERQRFYRVGENLWQYHR
jgi:hypothetical protein